MLIKPVQFFDRFVSDRTSDKYEMSKKRITYIHIFIWLFAIFANVPYSNLRASEIKNHVLISRSQHTPELLFLRYRIITIIVLKFQNQGIQDQG